MIELNNYETIYILKPDITEDKNLNLVNTYKTIINNLGGQNILIQHRGRRHLSYNINQYYDGTYVQMNYQGNGSIVSSLEKALKMNNNIMRYLTINNKEIKI
uniref:ribosomal protein S6 n=1 Tax=Hypnea musciformis TaxID=31429 RepID=UPI0027DA3A4E|nr:ribosomal protein S6 [Hypnea musciformis]WCH56826.1 ribosomal protein S6 [Hypnea musciformis]WCH57026.1 ribosomal protein S6 [Hypnea musciformis]